MRTPIVPLFVYPEQSKDLSNKLSLKHRISSVDATIDGFDVKTLSIKCQATVIDQDGHESIVGSESVEVDVLVSDVTKTNLKGKAYAVAGEADVMHCIEAMQLSDSLVVMEGEVTSISNCPSDEGDRWQDGMVFPFAGKIKVPLIAP